MKTSTLLATTMLLLCGCNSISTSYDSDPKASFDGLKTFSWHEAAGPLNAATASNPLLQKTIQDMTTEELRVRGYTPATSGTGDFTIGAFAVVEKQMDVAYTDSGWGPGGAYGYGGVAAVNTVVTTYDEGTLVLEIANGASGTPMWRGVAKAVVHRDQPEEKRRERLKQAIHETLLQFPPKR
jgi:hypothetical protein